MSTAKDGGKKTAAEKVAPATGKLGVMVVGLGAVATTMIAGVEAVRRGLAKPIGSLTQMGTVRLGKRTDNNSPLVKEFVPIANINDIVFTGWDIFEDNVYESAAHAKVLDKEIIEQLKPYLETIKPLPAVFDQYYVKRLHGTHVKKGKNKRDLADQVRADIQNFKKTVDRVVMIWCGSTEIFIEATPVHDTIESFEKGLETNDIGIAPSQIYAYAALSEGIPFANGAPNLTVDIPALIELSKKNSAPICGKDFKTGQTFMKTVLAPAFKARLLGVSGWYSTNILGNRDGEVLDDPESFKTKEDFLCRDSILAAPIALDLVLFLDLAKRTTELRSRGIQEWLSFYLKSPQTAEGLYPEHDLFIQSMKLKNTLRHIMGEDLITHLGLEYYD